MKPQQKKLVQVLLLILVASILVLLILWWLSPSTKSEPVALPPVPTPTPLRPPPPIDPLEEAFNRRLEQPFQASPEADEETPEEEEEAVPTSAAAIRNEIRMSLINIHAAEAAFFSETQRYSTDLRTIAWSPNDPSMAAQIGFLTVFDPPDRDASEDLFFLSTDQFVSESMNSESGKSAYHYTTSAEGFSLRSLESSCRAGCTASTTGFEALGAANLDADHTLDLWRINERRELEHIVDDLAP